MSEQLGICLKPQESVMSSSDIVDLIKSILGNEYLNGVDISLKNNLSAYDSIVINSAPSAYRDTAATDCLFARLKLQGKNPYIAFSIKWKKLFEPVIELLPPTKGEKAFLRIPILKFRSACHELPCALVDILKQIYLDSFCFTPFDCCSKYLECSNAKHCVHVDKVFSTACTYRKSLEAGNIFYGQNKQ